MNTENFEIVIDDVKEIMLPVREKHGEDTEKLSQFIEEITNVTEKHNHGGLSLTDSSLILMRVAMMTMSRFGTKGPARDFIVYMRRYADRAIKHFDQHN